MCIQSPMRYQWDERKRTENVAKHGVDFADAVAALEDPNNRTIADPDSQGETRWITLGKPWRSAPLLRSVTMRDEYDHVDSDFGPFAPSDTVPADFARRLERERDEARDKCASWIREWRGLRDFCRQLDEDANDRLRERDEAREKLQKVLKLLDDSEKWLIGEAAK